MLKILAVDDSKAVHAFLKVSVKSRPVEITHAYNGKEALAKLAETPQAFDLILMDWEMPVMDGPTTLGNLQKLGNSIPVLMMTTKNSPDDIMHVLGLGACEYMLKPFTQDILFEKIRQAIGEDLSHAA